MRLLALDNVLAALLEPGLSAEDRQSRQQRKVWVQNVCADTLCCPKQASSFALH